jgi:nucleotide-binding universal stress UspA family protein
MYRSIVVPLDGSAANEHVLPIAIQIARDSNATLRLVYVPGPDDASMLEDGLPLDVALPARSITCAQTYLKQIRERLAAGVNLTITADVLHASNAHENVTAAAVTNTDLVVLTTHDHNGAVRFRSRDITDALVSWSPAPLLALSSAGAAPDTEPSLKFQRILIPLDGSASAEQILMPAIALGTVMEAAYTLLYTVEPYRFEGGDPASYRSRLGNAAIAHEQAEAQDYLDGIALLMRHEGLEVETQVCVTHDAPSTIRQAALQYASDVIAMTTHGRGGLSRLLLGSVAVQVLRDSPVPVLLSRPQERRKRAGEDHS